MRILFISPYVPSRIRVRPYNWIKHLAALGHQVTLLTLVAGPDDRAALPEMEAVCEQVHTVQRPRWRPLWNGLRAIPGREPFQLVYSRLPAMDRLIEETIAKSCFDVAHIEHLRAACFEPALRGLPIIYDAVDSISLLFERTRETSPSRSSRLMARLDLNRTEQFEATIFQRFARTIISSAVDAQHILKLAGAHAEKERIKIMPNAVDLDHFYPNGHHRETNTIVFTGKMSYHANVAAALFLAKEIMPHIWGKRPDIQLQIVGKDPSAAVRALGQDKRVTVTGFVPDLRPYLWQASLSVSPIRYGAGTQFKILEAMASGVPVVTSSLACQGLTVEPGRHLLAADSAPEFAQKVLNLLESPTLQNKLIKEGRSFVAAHHSWHTQASRLVEIYQEAIEDYDRNA